jgi:hypothetical protein
MLLAGRERTFLSEYAIPSLTATPDACTDADVDELVRTYARDGGFAGAAALYRSALTEAEEIRGLAASKLGMPVLAIGGGSADFTPATMRRARSGEWHPVVSPRLPRLRGLGAGASR